MGLFAMVDIYFVWTPGKTRTFQTSPRKYKSRNLLSY